MSHEVAFSKLSDTLRRALDAPTIEESRTLVADALKRAERLAGAVTTAAVKRGRKGGTTTAERMKAKDPDYYKRIAAMRKTRGGGRPRKKAKLVPIPIEWVFKKRKARRVFGASR